MREINKEMEQDLIMNAKVCLSLRKTIKDRIYTIDERKAINNGDRAFVKFMKYYEIRFNSLINKYMYDGANKEDMLQICYFVMQDKICVYDHTKGVDFYTYLYNYLINALSEYKHSNSTIYRLPKDYLQERAKYYNLLNEYKELYGKNPSDSYMAEKLGVSISKIESYRNTCAKNMNLDDSINGDDKLLVGEDIPDASNDDLIDILIKEERSKKLSEIVYSLPIKQREIFIMKYKFFNNEKDRTNVEIAKVLCVSSSSVGERLERGYKMIRENIIY